MQNAPRHRRARAAQPLRSALVVCFLALCLSHAPRADAAVCYRSFTATAYPNCQLLSPSYALHWAVTNATVSYAVEVDGSVGWLGLGISDGGGMSGADITVVQTLDGGNTWTAGDYFAEQQGRPSLDTSLPGGSKDVTLTSVVRTANYTAAAFSRPLEDCDPWDWPVVEDVDQTLIWAYGPDALSYHGTSNRGSATVRLNPLPGAPPQLADPADLQVLSLILPAPVAIPTNLTTYMCAIIELPTDAKYHAIRYRPIINNSLVHHQVLYSCARTPTRPVGVLFECGRQMESACGAFYMVAAPGTGMIYMPPAAALPFGLGSVQYAMVQIHYNNPNGVAGQVDQSGFEAYVTRQLRPNDMGVLTLGSVQLYLAPGEASVQAAPNLCPGACTGKLAAPVNLYSSFFHMHHLGKSMSTRLIRNGTELPPVAFKNYYNYDSQGIVGAPLTSRTLMPGDSLVTTCTYDTLGQNDTTYFGQASTDEMCFNFLMYWPAQTFLQDCTTINTYGVTKIPFATCASADMFSMNNNSAFLSWLVGGKLVPSQLGGGTYQPYRSSCGLSALRTPIAALAGPQPPPLTPLQSSRPLLPAPRPPAPPHALRPPPPPHRPRHAPPSPRVKRHSSSSPPPCP